MGKSRAAVLGIATPVEQGFAKWIEEHVTFPNGMVDRIAPTTADRERAIVAEHFGIHDAAPVFCEPFRQWVLEDTFASSRPEYESVGVTIAPVSPMTVQAFRHMIPVGPRRMQRQNKP